MSIIESVLVRMTFSDGQASKNGQNQDITNYRSSFSAALVVLKIQDLAKLRKFPASLFTVFANHPSWVAASIHPTSGSGKLFLYFNLYQEPFAVKEYMI